MFSLTNQKEKLVKKNFKKIEILERIKHKKICEKIGFAS